jgi:hypothetical protein
MEGLSVSTPAQEGVAYLVEETPSGTWRRYRYPTGEEFAEYTSRRRLFGLPLYHRTCGRSPETGKPVTACGVVAVGQLARGVLAIGQVARGVVAVGQVAIGIVAVGQLAVGLLLGIGQVATGVVAVGQCAVGALLGLGQGATGYVAVGQSACGWYALGMEAHGRYVWDMNGSAPEAEAFFRSLLP